MRKAAMLSMVVVLTLGFPTFAKTAAETGTLAVTPKSLSGEVVAVFPEARQLIIKEQGWFTTKEVNFVVAQEAAPLLAELQTGERVEVSYVETQGHPLARNVRKIPAPRRG